MERHTINLETRYGKREILWQVLAFHRCYGKCVTNP